MAIFDPVADIFGIGRDAGGSAQQSALAILQGVNPPTAEDLQYKLQQMVYQGDITPEQANAIMQNPSLMAGIDVTTGRKAQLDALAGLQGIEDSGGYTVSDMADMSKAQGEINATDRGRREAIMQNMAERGKGGSGMELVANLQNAQDAATNENQAGLDIAAKAKQRALDAIAQSGQLGGQIQGQEFDEASRKAQAQDAINQFNARNSQDVVNANIAAKNAALERNASEKQRISDTNTELANEKARADAAAKQTAFEDQMGKAKAVSGGYGDIAANNRANQQAKDAFTGQLIGTAGTVASGYLAGKQKPNTYLVSDKNAKKDIEDAGDFNMDEFMASIDPKKFKYKKPGSPGQPDGDNVGVIAQDVESTPVGRTMVERGPDGKVLNMQKAVGVVLAALARLYDKVQEEEAND